MSANPTQEIIEFKFSEFYQANFPKMSRGDAYTQFLTRIALGQFPLSEADISSGITDGKHDGGIDSFHIIVNRTEAITPNTKGLSSRNAPTHQQTSVPFDVVIVQSKSDPGGWDTTALPKLREVIEFFLDTKQSVSKLRAYPLNDRVVDQIEAFRKYQAKLISLDPVRSFTVYLMAPASELAITPAMKRTTVATRAAIAKLLPSSTKVVVEMLGAEGIDRLRSVSTDFTGVLRFSERPVGVTHGKSQAWLGLITLRDYLEFIQRTRTTVIRDEFFTTNVRDFAGTKNNVNSAIRSTLMNDSSSAFWWVNNGVTILADHASDQTDNKWLLTNPQIVNGLQTSNVIHEASLAGEITRKRLGQSILVRVIGERDPAVRESIIIGTNNQTAVNSIQLYANDEFQVKLEVYLEAQGWFYERRRWQYRNRGVSASRVRSILDLAQAVIALRLLRPETARGRPRDLLKTDASYRRVFDSAAPLDLFSKLLDIMETVETYLRTPGALAIGDDPTNDRYYVAVGALLRTLGIKDLRAFDAAKSVGQIKVPRDGVLKDVHARLYVAAGTVADKKSRDTLFKSQAFGDSWQKNIVAWNASSPYKWTTQSRR